MKDAAFQGSLRWANHDMPQGFYDGRKVLVTGGASFIGSHLVDRLVSSGAKVTVVDNLSSGRLENLAGCLDRIEFINEDLEYASFERISAAFRGQEFVFHLAAIHGGRGYIDTHPADVVSNLAIDHRVFEASTKQGVEKVVYASSACVYPPKLQARVGSEYLLGEADTDPRKLEDYLSADIEYGWAKVMGEVQLLAFIRQYGLKGCSLRFVTAYGPRENESHAVMALIYKAFQRMEPFVIWGDGKQDRDFTYVEDIVEGTLLAGEKVSDGAPINLGTGKRYTINDVASRIFELLDWKPKEISYDRTKPVGVVSRALDISNAKRLLGWEPRFTLEEGLRATVRWYVSTHTRTGKVEDCVLIGRG